MHSGLGIFLILCKVKYFKFSLLALLLSLFSTAFTVVDHPIVVADDTGEVRSADTLSFSRRHSEAVKSITIWRDTLRAERLWREIIAEDSLYAPALYALSGLRDVAPQEACEFSRRAYLADSSNKWYCRRYGQWLYSYRRYDEALVVYNRLMALDGDDPSTYYDIASIYRLKQMPYSAIAILDSADIRVGRNDYLARYRQQLLIDTRQYDRAIEEGQRLVLDSPSDADLYLDLARTYVAAGRDSLAAATYESAYRVDSADLGVIQELWEYYVDVDNVQRVFELEERIVLDDRVPIRTKVDRVKRYVDNDEIYRDNFFRVGRLLFLLTNQAPTNREVVSLYTKHLFYSGQAQAAAEYLYSHLGDSNVSPDDFMLAIELGMAMDDGDAMFNALGWALDIFPTHVPFISLAADTIHNLGDTKEAISILQRAMKDVESDEDRSTLWCTIGDMYIEIDKPKSAFKAYGKSLDYNSENTTTLNNYAYFLSLEGRSLDKALAMAQLAITLDSAHYTFLDTYAWILHLLGRNQEAKKYMLQALSMSRQQDATLLVHYADILWSLGEKFMAETYWKKAESLGYDAAELKAHIYELKSNSK